MPDTTLDFDALTGLVTDILVGAGLSPQQGAAQARVLAAGERDGCTSHGVYRVEGCLRTLKAGKVVGDAVPDLTGPDGAIVRVDARGGFASAAYALGAPVLADTARRLGLAALVINDCCHSSALWPEVEAMTDQGLAAMALCPSYATMAPAGGNAPLLGTNPFAFGWPRPDAPPYVFDFATSVAARGEIELHRRAGTPLPPGWAVDASGAATTDAEAALAGAMLPFGGHKGSAIATMIELLAGAMIGDLTSPEALEALGTTALAPSHGELVLAFDPARFAAGRSVAPLERAEALFDAFLGQGARLPGQRRFAARARAATHGIPMRAADMEILERLRRDGLAAVTV